MKKIAGKKATRTLVHKPKIESKTQVATAVMSSVQKEMESLSRGEFVTLISDYLQQNPIVGWVSTGLFLLDCAIGTPTGRGLPMPSIVEILGLESSLKSMLCFSVMGNIQRMGGWVQLLDAEGTFTHDYGRLARMRMDSEAFGYGQIQCLEDVMDVMLRTVKSHVELAPDMPFACCLDSVAATTTDAERLVGTGEPARALHARILARALRSGLMTSMYTKIPMDAGTALLEGRPIVALFINQLKASMNHNPYAPQWESFGGRALKYHSRVRIELTRGALIKDKERGDAPLGFRCKAKIIKNKVAPERREVEFDFRYDTGLEDYFPVIDFVADHGGLAKSGNYFIWHDKKYYPNALREHMMVDADAWKELRSICLEIVKKIWGAGTEDDGETIELVLAKKK